MKEKKKRQARTDCVRSSRVPTSWGKIPQILGPFVRVKNDYMDFHKCVFYVKGFFVFFWVKYYIIVSNCLDFYYISITWMLWGGCALCTNNVEFLASADFNRLGLYVPCPKGKQNFFSRFGSFRGGRKNYGKTNCRFHLQFYFT